MNRDLHIPWEQYGLIVELTRRLHKKRPQLGKTALQKLVYLLQDAYGVKCGYDFSLYTYGPFTSELLHDLDVVESVGGVSVTPVRTDTGGYQIDPGESAQLISDEAQEFLTAHRDAIDELINVYGHYSARELEIRATTVYVAREMKRDEKSLSFVGLVKRVHDIKPYFPVSEIKSVVEELQEKEHVEVAG